MTRREYRRLAHLGAGLVLALLLGDVLSPAEASAACGDHVRSAREASALPDSIPVPPSPAPCTGLACSAPEQPPLAPVAPKLGETEVWAALLCPSDAEDRGQRDWARRDDGVRPVGRAASIFHPPR